MEKQATAGFREQSWASREADKGISSDGGSSNPGHERLPTTLNLFEKQISNHQNSDYKKSPVTVRQISLIFIKWELWAVAS